MLENFRTQKIIWDSANKKIFEKIEANSGDSNGRKLVVQVINQGVTEGLSGTTLSLGWKSRNGAKGLDAFDVVDASKGIFEIYYTTEMLSNIGNIEASLILINSTGRIESSTFTISVRPSTVDDESVESENSFTALTEALVKVNDLEANYAPRLNEVTAQLVQTDKSVSNDRLTQNLNSGTGLSVGVKKTQRPLITFIDDDGAVEVYTRLKPIFESRGVPCTIAIVSDWADGKESTNGTIPMPKEQILELKNLGWEVASHSKTHARMQEITDEKSVNAEVIESKEKLLELGFDVKNYVRPYGQTNPVLEQAITRYYKTSVSTNNNDNDEVNNLSTSNYSLRRVALGSYGGNNDSLAHHKAVIDKAIAENGWLIFMTHVWAHPIENDQLIADVLDYAISKNVEIVNLDDGLEVFGDKININDSFRITAENRFVSDNFVIGRKGSLIDSASKASDISFLLNNYNSGEVVYSIFSFAKATGMPENWAGVLTTFLETTETGYIYQTYRTHGTGKLFSRAYGSTGWTVWAEHSYEKVENNKTTFIIPSFAVEANEVKTVTVDLTNILGTAYKTAQRPYVLTNRNSTAKMWSSYIRTGILNIHFYNHTESSVIIGASDWDILFLD
ncbi:BppU family phage baseplate upper protein [Jeotgalibaca porci]|uniref:BppU family phage baseplate upper protein n=1 Tax=Jeotgalibaca porci TaxID=1868793 RepID=UPI0035A0F557